MRYFISTRPYTHHGGTTVKLTEMPVGTLISRDKVTDSNRGMEYITLGIGEQKQFYLSAAVVESSPEYFEEISRDEFVYAVSSRELINTAIVMQSRGISLDEVIEMLSYYRDTQAIAQKTIEPQKENELGFTEDEIEENEQRQLKERYEATYGKIEDTPDDETPEDEDDETPEDEDDETPEDEDDETPEDEDDEQELEPNKEFFEDFLKILAEKMKDAQTHREKTFHETLINPWVVNPFDQWNRKGCYQCGNDGSKPCHSISCPNRIQVYYTVNRKNPENKA